jgi:gallate decarboxylase subunit D
MDTFDISEKNGIFEVSAHVLLVGSDIIVILTGGRSHIGAVAIAQPRPSLKDAKKIGSTSSVFTRVGHKEDVVAKAMSEEISKRLNKVVVVAAGIHWDKMKKRQIETIVEMCNSITKKVIAEVSKT